MSEYATTDLTSRRKSTRRKIKMPGEKRHVERAESPVQIARRIEVEKRERRLRGVR